VGNFSIFIGDFIVDFICLDKKLIIEVDGGYHSEPRQIEDDALRQQWLEKRVFRVIRFTNEELEFDSDNVCKRILGYLKGSDASNSSIKPTLTSLKGDGKHSHNT